MRRSAGFTLIELLVVIAIIGVLVAILLPAVQQAREAARASQCRNNLKQIGIALHGYHEIHSTLPVENPLCDGAKRWGWVPLILPQMDLGPVYNQFDFSQASWQGNNFQFLQKRYPSFLCPSNSLSDQLREEEFFAAPMWIVSQSDYAACIGDYRNGTGIGATPDFGNVDCTGDGQVRGMIGRWRWSARFNQVPDGLSNTFMIGEGIGALSITQNWGVQNWATTAFPINYLNSSLMTTIPTQANPRWAESIGFRSEHVGGTHFCFGDGAIKFVSENIDGTTYRALASRANKEIVEVP